MKIIIWVIITILSIMLIKLIMIYPLIFDNKGSYRPDRPE